MSEAIKTKPSLPDDAGLWMSARKLMMAICVGTPRSNTVFAVTPQDEERIAPGQNGLYCRKKMLSRFTIQRFNSESVPGCPVASASSILSDRRLAVKARNQLGFIIANSV
jgi:hypothetical protein